MTATNTTTQSPENLTTDHSRATADEAHTHGQGAAAAGASRGDRGTSFALADFPLPNGREEDWRFTPVNRLQKIFAGDLTGEGPTVSVEHDDAVQVERVGRDDARLGNVGSPGDRASAAAWESFREAVVITVPKGHAEGEHTAITVAGQPGGAPDEPAAQHLLVVAEELSESLVVLDHRGGAHLSQTVEIDVRDGAHLTLISIQDWDDGAIHVASHRARLGRDARLKHIVVTLGGDVVRLTPESSFAAPGGDVEMLGLYFTDSGQHQEHRLFVDHAVESCKSRVTYKGALQGASAHAVWIGDVLIRKAAEGTDTYELNRNLVLTEGARADSVPNLEIETGEIAGAGHASATGRFDDEQLFYLRSRGIDEADARRLVVRGFFAELINQIGVPLVQERLMTAIDVELDHTMEAAAR
ncbi:Fe-S cluster assembly protein SufD [Georgenia halophila]|uniref:Fe-S cluster assembly protein SufD n=1 Tax=Georgenia halophila TaxID=620889 RepID=A0ABP8L518_9MICO